MVHVGETRFKGRNKFKWQLSIQLSSGEMPTRIILEIEVTLISSMFGDSVLNGARTEKYHSFLILQYPYKYFTKLKEQLIGNITGNQYEKQGNRYPSKLPSN